MALTPAPNNDEVLSESPTGDQPLATSSSTSLGGDIYDSSLSEWRSAMKSMSPSENIQVAGMGTFGTELLDSVKKWFWPTKPESPKSENPETKAKASTLKSFDLNDWLSINSQLTDKQKKNPPPLAVLPVGGTHLEGRSKDVIASLYRDRATANGEKFNPEALTAAHRTLPFNTIVDLEYTDPTTGKTKVVKGVRINDDGPHVAGSDKAVHIKDKPRELDVSPRVARELGFTDAGLGQVKMTIVKWGDNKYANGVTLPAGSDFRNKIREAREYFGLSNFSLYK